MRQLARNQTSGPFSNPPAEALARRVAGLAPVAGAKVFFTPGGGSDAIDTAAKLARAYWRAAGQPGRHVLISRSHAHHRSNAHRGTPRRIPAHTRPVGPPVSIVQHRARG